jgi:vitamin B12 transporter
MKLGLVFCILALALAASPLRAVAETPSRRAGAHEASKIEGTTVTAGRIKQQILDVTVPVETITTEDIEATGMDDLGDVLGKFMTGHLHKYNGVLTSVGIRSFRSESMGDDLKGHVLILVDGHRVGTGNVSKIDVDRVERIEILKGPFSALYGSAALGGVVNIITKKGDGPFRTKLRGEYGSFNYHKLGVASGGEVFEDKFKFFVNTSYRHQEDYVTPDFDTVINSSYQHTNVGWNATYMLNPKHSFRWGGNYADIAGGYPKWEDGTYSKYIETTQNFDKSHGYTDFEYNGGFFDGFLSWRSQFYYLWDRNHWKYGEPNADDTATKYTDKTYGTDQQFTLDFGAYSTLVFGFTFEYLEKESEGWQDGEPSTPYTPAMEYNSRAFFAQDLISLWDDRLHFVVALRYDYLELETKKPGTGQFEQFNLKSESFDHISPKAGGSFSFLDRLLRVRANLGTGFKTPSAEQFSAEYRGTNDQGYLGNPNLDPETSLTWDLGMDLFHSIIDVGLTYWHTDYEDKIVQSSEQVFYKGKYWTTWENLGEAEIEGVDFTLDLRLHKLIGMEPGLSLHNRTTLNLKYEDKETGEDLFYVSEYESKSWINFHYRGLSASLFYVLVGPQQIQNFDDYPTTRETMEAFDFWDFQISYSFLDNWKITFNIFNLTDERIEWIRGYPQAERHYHLALTFEF